MQKLQTLFCAIALAGLSGCSGFPGVYQYPVEQGNPLSERQIEQLDIGMTEEQVLFVLGSPALVNRLETGRWIYVFEKFVGDELLAEEKLQVRFEDGRVSEIIR